MFPRSEFLHKKVWVVSTVHACILLFTLSLLLWIPCTHVVLILTSKAVILRSSLRCAACVNMLMWTVSWSDWLVAVWSSPVIMITGSGRVCTVWQSCIDINWQVFRILQTDTLQVQQVSTSHREPPWLIHPIASLHILGYLTLHQRCRCPSLHCKHTHPCEEHRSCHISLCYITVFCFIPILGWKSVEDLSAEPQREILQIHARISGCNRAFLVLMSQVMAEVTRIRAYHCTASPKKMRRLVTDTHSSIGFFFFLNQERSAGWE